MGQGTGVSCQGKFGNAAGMGHSQCLRERGRPTVTAEHRAAAPLLPFQSQESSEKTKNPPDIGEQTELLLPRRRRVQAAPLSGTRHRWCHCNSSLLPTHPLQTHQHLLVFLHFSFLIHSRLLFRFQSHKSSSVLESEVLSSSAMCARGPFPALQPQSHGIR